VFAHYLRTTGLFHGAQRLNITPWASVRPFLPEDAQALAAVLAKRNSFARHRGRNDFYTSKAEDFSVQTVVELMIPGVPPVQPSEARVIADRVERLLIAATTHWLPRRKLHSIIGIANIGRGIRDLYIGPGATRLSTRWLENGFGDGLVIDAEFARRWERTGLPAVAAPILRPRGFIPERVDRALAWLNESRLDHHSEAALIKAVIGLENLFVQDKTEPLARTISERIAFVLGRTTEQRAALARVALHLYDLRSRIVHGSSKPKENIDHAVDVASLLLLLAAHALIARAEEMQSKDDVRRWVEQMRWAVGEQEGAPLPFSTRHVGRVLRRGSVLTSTSPRGR
jgi:hypothetical protein